jgi:6-phosphogluconate dehydrogenase (decarboxylating)
MVPAGTPTVASDPLVDIHVAPVAEVWRRGSVLSSWHIDLAA